MKKRKYILIKQQDQFDCGAACIASIAAYYGLHVPIARIRHYTNTDRKGTTILGFLEAAEKLGFQSKALRAKPEQLGALPLPAIAHIVTPERIKHTVILYEVHAKYVVIGDPANSIRKVPIEEFLQQWTSLLILIVPGEKFEAANLDQSHLRQFFSLLKPQRVFIFQALVAAVLYTVLGLLIAVYVGTVFDTVFPDGDARLLHILSVGMIVLIVFKSFFAWMRSYLLLIVSQKVDVQLILGYYKHILSLPQSFFDFRRVGEIISRVNDATKIRNAISGATLVILVDSLMVLFTFAVMFYFSWKLALLTALLFPAFLLVFALLKNSIKRTQQAAAERYAELQSHFTSSIAGIETIKAVSAEAYSNYKTETVFSRVIGLFAAGTRQQMINNTATDFISSIAVVGLFWFGSTLVLSNEMSIGELVAYYALLGYMTGPLSRLTGLQQILQDALIATRRLFEILAIETEDQENTLKVRAAWDNERASIEFRNCNYRYGAREQVLYDLTFTIPAGKVTAIVGESGSGKSTILRLLQKLYTVSSGTLLFNGTDIRDIDVHSLRRLLGVVPQQIELFHGTVLENITYGDAVPDTARVLEICRLIGADTFINALPERYNTMLGEHGASISGGQRQTLAIARALYKNPEILLLDEATSNLDSETEAVIQNVLHIIARKKRTVMLIAHRLSTVMFADTILVLHKGKILEHGTHEELLHRRGKYYDMWMRQVPPALVRQLAPQPESLENQQVV